MILVNIIWPTFALVALIFGIWITMVHRRLGHMKAIPPKGTEFASGDTARQYFQPVATPGDNLTNLFEMPVLYFALVPLLLITGQSSGWQVVLAWAFVALRLAHSVIHTGSNNVMQRFYMYLASSIVLSAMWIGFFVNVASAAWAYHQAMGAGALHP